MNIQYGPIKQWPGKLRESYSRLRAPFKSSHTKTLQLLESELHMARAESPVVQLAIEDRYWTRDGRPYAQAKGLHPGVIVSFVKSIGAKAGARRIPLSFPCDRFTTWESNLRAIALSLEALRKVDRYGVTQNAEQYTGFKQLPPPGPEHETIQTVEDAARFVAAIVGHDYPADLLIKSPDNWRSAYRAAAAKLHPDANGGIAGSRWAILQAAQTLLDAHHKV